MFKLYCIYEVYLWTKMGRSDKGKINYIYSYINLLEKQDPQEL